MLLAIPLLVASGCDPEGPGACGELRMGANASVGAATHLVVHVYENGSGAFDPAQPLPFGYTEVAGLDEVTFPYDYCAGESVGTTPVKHWRATAWLTKEPTELQIDADMPYASVAFDVDHCSWYYNGYCEKTGGVDLELHAPE